jgi:hypothetical protein
VKRDAAQLTADTSTPDGIAAFYGWDTDPEATKAALRAEFPGWSIIHSNAGRWWAMRHKHRDPQGRLIDHPISDISADTPGELAARLRELS